MKRKQSACMTLAQMTDEIKRMAVGGRAPGAQRFCRATGLNEWSWNKMGLTWSDLVRRAGFAPNPFSKAVWKTEEVIRRYVLLVRELGKVPITRDLRFKRARDRTFPGLRGMGKLGTKRETLEAAIEYCTEHGGFDDVRELCEASLKSQPPPIYREPEPTGFVYLFRAGTACKIGMTTALESRMSALSKQIPHKGRLLHVIATDDPAGIEQYWHRRFADKRTHGEWFQLDSLDVLAFKRRKFM